MVTRCVLRRLSWYARITVVLTAVAAAPALAQVPPAPAAAAESGAQAASHTSYLEVWVDSSDASHLSAVLARVSAIQERGQLPVVAVYHLGSYKNITPEVRARLHRLKVRLIAQSAVPSDLPVVNSPAWIFVSPQGRHIVEGTLAIEPFIGPSGDFVDGSKVAASSAAGPVRDTVKMEGF